MGTRQRYERSPSVKRVREGEQEGEWRIAENRRKSKPKVVSGTAEITEFGDLAGPAIFWIGNTHPSTDANTVSKVLQKCAEDLKVVDFKIEDIYLLTKDDNPRSRSWKVTVPARLTDTMMNPGMYVKGWNHRVFTQRTGAWKRPVAPPVTGSAASATEATQSARP